MRTLLFAFGLLSTASASAQTVTSVYNRDTHEPFRLKSVKVESTVVGPLVKTSTLLTYANPYEKLTEATLNFDMPEAAALGGFAYYYGDEYVRGRLMDKAKAWAIYTAITSRDRDPGIMEQASPTNYHCQIYPIKKGHDLRVRLWTVGTLQPKDGKMTLPKPQVPNAVSYYETADASIAEPKWTVRTVKSGPAVKEGDGYRVEMGDAPVRAVAQQFKDGRVYVAGILRAMPSKVPSAIRIDKAIYEPVDGSVPGIDATEAVARAVVGDSLTVASVDALVGDPKPYFPKQLRVEYHLNGTAFTAVTPEYKTFRIGEPAPQAAPSVSGLKDVKIIPMADDTVAFTGWGRRNGTIKAKYKGTNVSIRPERIAKGGDAAKIWAQQMLASDSFRTSREVLKFSMKYGVPSNATALLAVPQSEMKLFREKEKEFNKAQAETRRRELENQREARNWTGQRNQNWDSSGGGDPEIRVVIPNAKSVDAILPDRRVIPLKPNGDAWGGNFEIPASAPEGVYKVRVLARMADGTTSEQSWTYAVDRTAPVGKAEFLLEGGRLILQVRSEAGLYEVKAYAPSGRQWTLKEETPGVYRIEIPKEATKNLKVILKDRADNKGEITPETPRLSGGEGQG